MKAIIVIVFWLLLGLLYWQAGNVCCPNMEEAVKQIGASTSSNNHNSRIGITTTELGKLNAAPLDFENSSVIYSRNDSLSSLIKYLQTQLANGASINIVGLATGNNKEAAELALLRAKEFQMMLSANNSNSQLSTRFLSDKDASSERYVYYTLENELPEANLTTTEQVGMRVLVEGKTTYLFMDRELDSKKVDKEVIKGLQTISNRLQGNFCSVSMIAYSDDHKKARQWIRYAKDYLIRAGVIPNRISSRVRTTDKNQHEVLEIKIRD